MELFLLGGEGSRTLPTRCARNSGPPPPSDAAASGGDEVTGGCHVGGAATEAGAWRSRPDRPSALAAAAPHEDGPTAGAARVVAVDASEEGTRSESQRSEIGDQGEGGFTVRGSASEGRRVGVWPRAAWALLLLKSKTSFNILSSSAMRPCEVASCLSR